MVEAEIALNHLLLQLFQLLGLLYLLFITARLVVQVVELERQLLRDVHQGLPNPEISDWREGWLSISRRRHEEWIVPNVVKDDLVHLFDFQRIFRRGRRVNYMKPRYGLLGSVNCLHQNLIRDEVARDDVKDGVLGRVDVLQEPRADHEHLEPTGGDGVRPAHERVVVVALDDGWAHNHHGQVSPALLEHALGEALREGIRVGVDTEDGLLLLVDGLGAQLEDAFDDFLAVLATRQVIHLLLYLLVGHDVAVHVGC